MYPSGRRSAARLPPTNFMNLKTVEVGRGRNGYGFTVAGQQPCVLSCIMPNSPAEVAMLKPGDCVIAVNGENVTRLSHEQFIKLIGETTGVLRLTVADIATEESSDDEEYYEANFQGRASFPRSRSATPGVPRSQMVLEDLNSGALFHAYPARTTHYQAQMFYGSTNGFNTRVDDQDKFAPGHLSPFNRKGQQLNLRKTPQVYENSYWNGQGVDMEKTEPVRSNKPKRRRDQRQRPVSVNQRTFYVQEDPYADDEEEVDVDTRPLTPYELNNITYPSMVRTGVDAKHPTAANQFMEGDSSFMRVIVGYLGSVDIPAAANLPTASLQAIRGCVRRLRIEQRIHSLMLMDIAASGIRLISASGLVTAVYPAEKIVFSGICPDDKRCFGIVTIQTSHSASKLDQEDDEPIGSACHVFIVDPELSSHDMHCEISIQFGLDCAPNPENHTCVEFPSSSRVVLHHVSKFYQDKQNNSHFGDFYGQTPYVGVSRRSNSGSSNSDSGFGNGVRDGVQTNGSDQIVDVASHIRNQRANRTLHSMPLNQGVLVPQPKHNSQNGDIHLSGSTSPTSIEASPSANQYGKPNLEDRLTPRARPDPVKLEIRPSRAVMPTVRAGSVNLYDMSRSSTLPHTQRDVRRVPLRQVSHEPGWGNGINLPPNGLSTNFSGEGMYNHSAPGHRIFMGRPSLPVKSHLQSYQPEAMNYQDKMRRGSDCSEYSSSHLAAKKALLRVQSRKLQNLQRQDTESLTASDGELPTIDDPQRQDGNRGSHADLADERPPEVGRVSGWAVSFERLLKDELGLAYFTDFLKQEFSEENILFWIACEQLSQVTKKAELRQKADNIYHRFLSPEATMPVNLEGDYRQMVEKAIKNPSPEMYKEHQLQIFKLMKLDSYSRFLKSKLYQDCVLSEMGNHPMPTIETQSITELGSDNGQVDSTSDLDKDRNRKKKAADKVGKNKMQSKELERPQSPQRQISDDKKGSLFPWFKGFTGKRQGSQRNDTQFYVSSPQPPSPIHVSQSDTQLLRGAHSMSPTRECTQKTMMGFTATFPNNVTAAIKVVSDKCIGEVLLPLCEEHGLTQQTAEIFITSTKEGLRFKEKLVDLHQDVGILAGKEIIIERRVVFKIELPNKRLIGVKSKPTKKLIEVLRPVTYKYQLQLDALVVHLSNSPIPLDLEITVAALDNQRIMIETLEQYSAGNVKTKDESSDPLRGKSVDNVSQQTKEEVEPEGSKPPTKSTIDEPPLSSDIGSNEKDMLAALTMQQNNNNARGNLRVSDTDGSDLYRLVARANRRRLDDQRGLTLRNLELPEFLLPKEAPDRPASALGYSELEQERNRINQEACNGPSNTVQGAMRPQSTPPRHSLPIGESGFYSGTIPTHEEADAVFGGLSGKENISFGESLGSSGYPDSLANTSRSYGDGMSMDQYQLPLEEPLPDEKNGEFPNHMPYNPKVSGVSIMSEIDLPSSPGADLDVTLTAQNVGEITLPPMPTPGPDVTLQAGLADFTPPAPVHTKQQGQDLQKSRLRGNGQMAPLKTLYEESSPVESGNALPSSKSRFSSQKKPEIPPKPRVSRTSSLPAGMANPPTPNVGVVRVLGTDGRTHRATFV